MEEEAERWPADFYYSNKSGYISWAYAIWIVDEKTVYLIDENFEISTQRPTSDDESTVLELEQYSFNEKYGPRQYERTVIYYLFHYIHKGKQWEGRYAMNGSKMVVNTDKLTNTLTWDYSNGTIVDDDGIEYVKIR